MGVDIYLKPDSVVDVLDLSDVYKRYRTIPLRIVSQGGGIIIVSGVECLFGCTDCG